MGIVFSLGLSIINVVQKREETGNGDSKESG